MGFEIWSGGMSVSSDLGVMTIAERKSMEPKYFIGQRLTLDRDYNKLCDAPKGTLVYTPSGKVVERNYPNTDTFYGNAGGRHIYELDGDYIVVGVPEQVDKTWELAKELWEVRSESLTGTRWEWDVNTNLDEEDEPYQKVYRAIADYVLAREAAL